MIDPKMHPISIPMIAGLMGLSASTRLFALSELQRGPPIWIGRPRGAGKRVGRAWYASKAEYRRDPKTRVLTRRRPRHVEIVRALRAAKKAKKAAHAAAVACLN